MVIPISSDLYQILREYAETRRIVFIAGLPGVGKSLLIQQLSLIATQAGRKVHLLQWLSARTVFETANNLAKYPEVDGVTDPAIRKAVGMWARGAVLEWDQQHPESEHLLIGEVPLIGNRLIELAEQHDDAVEPLLASEQTVFAVPVPSWEVREEIEKARARTLASPRNEWEKLDAAPNVLTALWQDVNELARDIKLTKARPDSPYNPYIYGGVYEALLQNRQNRLLLIDEILRPSESVYELDVLAGELQATSEQVREMMQRVEEQYTSAALREAVSNWHAIITENPRVVDPGPELHIPLAKGLPNVVAETVLTAVQTEALQAVLTLPLDADVSQVLVVLDGALAALAENGRTETIEADLKKHNIYDGYFNVTRSDKDNGVVFLGGLLLSYRNVLANLQKPPQTLTVVELPLLRVALEAMVRLFV